MSASFPPDPSSSSSTAANTPSPCFLPLPPHPNTSLSSASSPSPYLSFNYTVSEEELQRGRVISALAILRLCLAVFGCVANTIAAVVLTNRKLWSPTSMLLLSLVIYDAFYLLLGIPVGATSISVNLNFTPAGYSTLRTMMALCFPLRSMAQMGSTYTTLTVTLERFLVILLPLRASSMWTYGKTRRAIVGLLLFSVLFNLPRCFDHILSKPRTAPMSVPMPAVSINGNLSSTVFNASSSSPSSSSSSSFFLARHGEQLDGRGREVHAGITSFWNGTGNNATGNGNVSCLRVRKGGDSAGGRASELPRWNHTHSVRGKNSGNSGVYARASAESREEGEREEEEEGVSEEVVYFYKVVYQFYLTIIFLYFIPYTLIPVLNLQLVIALRRRRDESRRLSVKNEHRLNWTRCRLTVASKAEKEDGGKLQNSFLHQASFFQKKT